MAETLSQLFKEYSESHPEDPVLLVKDDSGNYQPVTWGELFSQSRAFGAGLMKLGTKKGDHVGIVSENRKEWLVADFAILGIGAADVPRGSDSMAEEIRYILAHADCACSLVENKTQLDKVMTIKSELPLLKTLIVMDPDYDKEPVKGVKVLSFADVLAQGESFLQQQPDCFENAISESRPDDLATLIYTSGTTGEPKGVMLTHGNYMHQVYTPYTPLDIREGDVFLSVLPVWHSYERTLEYVAIFGGCTLAYSKPIGQILLEDMGKARPMIFPSVPRIWERVKDGIYRNVKEKGGVSLVLFNFFVAVGSAYSKLSIRFRGLLPQFRKRSRVLDILVSIVPLLLLLPFNLLGQALVFSKLKKRLGGRFRFGVSGGGALPPHVDDFFAAAGIMLLEGYGLTESSPIVSVRESHRPVPGTIGPPLPEVEVKIVSEEGKVLPAGEKGVLHVRGPNIMKGYYKKPEETNQAIDADGWLNTGDLALLTHSGEIKILGRVKETIVLLGGENIEPGPIEDMIKQSVYVDQVMVVGQDQKNLAALIVPSFEAVSEYAKTHGIPHDTHEQLLDNEEIYSLFMDEVSSVINLKRGFKLFERIHRLAFLGKMFEPGVEMTHSLKLKRNVIEELYSGKIAGLFTR